MSARPSAPSVAPVAVRTSGHFAPHEPDLAQAAVAAVLARHPMVADGVRVRLTGAARADGPALMQVNLYLCGGRARIQAAGPSISAAITAGADRLDRQLQRLTTAWEPWPWPDPQRPALDAPGRGRIVRRKTYSLHSGLPCQAAAVLSVMDYDVYLYTDTETGEDAIIYRAGPAGLRLARQHSMRPPTMPVALPLTVNPHRTPSHTPAEAADRLADGCLPYLFFTDAGSRRGNLLYRRYDGDLGLISPTSPAPPTDLRWVSR